MNKIQKLSKAMERDSIGPKEALEQGLSIYSAEPDYSSLEVLVKSILYAMFKKLSVYTAIMGEAIPDNPEAILDGATYKGFDVRSLELKDGNRAVVVITDQKKLKEVPPTPFLEVALDELMGYTVELNVDGMLINPGPDNYYLPMEMVKGFLEQWEMAKKLAKKNSL